MNKQKTQKLQLTRNTVRALSDVGAARGGAATVDWNSVHKSCYEICNGCPVTNQVICHISRLAC